MFGDIALRDEMPHRKSIRIKDTKNAFSFVSANNFAAKMDDFQEVFKSE